MRFSKFIFLIVFLFFVRVYSYAQHKTDGDKSITNKIEEVVDTTLVDSTDTENEAVWDKDDGFIIDKQMLLINDSAESLKNNKDFAYAKNLDSTLKELKKKETNQVSRNKNHSSSWLEHFFSSSFTKIIFWSLAIIFIVFILYKLFLTEGIFQRKSKASDVISLQEEEHLSTTTDYNKLIVQSIANKDYRLATRYHYMQTLQKLAAKMAIIFMPDKTNYQYIIELNSKPYKNDFAKLTLNYEYAWYGNFYISEQLFYSIQNKFIAFNNQL